MADEDKPPEPERSSGDRSRSTPRKRIPKGRVRPPEAAVYEAWWESYRDGERSAPRLAAAFRISIHTARRAVEHGWPQASLPALKDRAQLHDQKATRAMQVVVAAAETSALAAAGTTLLGTWEAAARRALDNVKESGEALGILGKRIREAAELANFVRYRKVPDIDPATRQPRRDAKGHPVMILKSFVDGATLAAATRLWVSAQRDQVALSQRLFGEVFPDAMGAEDLPDLRDDQLALLEAGEIPEDLAAEDLARVVISLSRNGGGD